MTKFKTFKEISINCITKEELLARLVESGVQFNKYAHILFEHPSFLQNIKSETVELVKVNFADLQLTKPCIFQEIVQKALDLNLKLCPLYIGAFLRLAYLEQAEGPYLTIASAKPEGDENYPSGFYVRNIDNSLWLRGYNASDDYEWPIDNEFIFQK